MLPTTMLWLSLVLQGNEAINLYARPWENALGHDEYLVREKAQRKLEQTAPLFLVRALGNSKDSEVKARAKRLYEARRCALLKSLEPYPMLDAFWWNSNLKSYNFTHPMCLCLQRRINRFSYQDRQPPFKAYYQATYSWSSDMIDSGVPVWVLRCLFLEMRRRDNEFYRSSLGQSMGR